MVYGLDNYMTETERTLSEKDIAKLERDFPSKENQSPLDEEFMGAVKGLAALILFICPESRERSLAWNKLQECAFWGGVSIARNE